MLEVNIREIRSEECSLLKEFLYLAVYQSDHLQPIPRSVIDEPRVRIYVDAFGESADDIGLVAQADGQVIGVAWARVLDGEPRGYGYVDSATPEIAISLLPSYRGRGIGTRLLRNLLSGLAVAGYARTSLSVDRDNPASRLYARMGFEIIAEQDEDLLMVRQLSPKNQAHI
ncbi:MAG: GNAT family N-acetyltransferase [Coriobacteriia bacterium]|nr:GNAT family N-acetyltransferase [Coriobacteriia bacterium]